MQRRSTDRSLPSHAAMAWSLVADDRCHGREHASGDQRRVGRGTPQIVGTQAMNARDFVHDRSWSDLADAGRNPTGGFAPTFVAVIDAG
jgi:hypothetical protein